MTPNETSEIEGQKSIHKLVDDYTSFRFNAGAGAGKTYALIETLKYVTINKIVAIDSPQKVACITYTNVAVNEIKDRLGNSDAVQVSTIHERIWDLIKRAQPQLINCHKEKIVSVIEQSIQDLSNSPKAKFFNDLIPSQQQEFIEFTIRTKDFYYESKDLGATHFRKAYEDNTEIGSPNFLNNCLTNVSYFKYVVSLLYKKQRLEECLKRIDSGEEKRVNYDSKVNSDRLYYMRFSHETLLEYGLKLVETYPTLCRIIIDSYPYFFIDEYQDTHSNVVKFVKTIHDYAIDNNKKWVVGYFGDTAQSIYDDGVGQKIVDIHDNLVDVDKIFNRRSHEQIINVANKIRADKIVQKPFCASRNTGSASFYYNDSEDKLSTAQQFLHKYKCDLNTDNGESGVIGDEENKIHCLVLTNKLMASFNGFGEVYEVYQNSIIYYDNLNTQVLSQQLEKLHPTVLIIYKLIKLYRDIQQGKVSYYDIFGLTSREITFSKASLIIHELGNKKVSSLKDWFDLITERIENSTVKEELEEILMNRIHFQKDKVVKVDVFRSTLLENIHSLMNKGTEDQVKEKINNILALPITPLIKWVNFIEGIESEDISYHTYHGTKGKEYENVAIILEHSFGTRNRNKFKNYFELIQKDEEVRKYLITDPEAEEKYINTRNLLYVACSRAIKNLRVLYLDDISEIRQGIEEIFGESKAWPIVE